MGLAVTFVVAIAELAWCSREPECWTLRDCWLTFEGCPNDPCFEFGFCWGWSFKLLGLNAKCLIFSRCFMELSVATSMSEASVCLLGSCLDEEPLEELIMWRTWPTCWI